MSDNLDSFAGAPSSTRTITNLHRSNQGKVSNKWSSYLTYYDRLFDPIKDQPIRILEVGIQNGGSLETWSRYFKNAEAILGCDIDEKCGALTFEDPRIDVIVGNANSDITFKKIAARGPFDVIIDDGSHLSEDILVGFLNYFPHIRPGGIYVIEDTHAIYQRDLTSIHNSKSALGFFKDLTDIVSYQFWHKDKSIVLHLGAYLSVELPGFLSEGWVDTVEFRNSIITIKKSLKPDHNKLGQMTVTGNTADVDPEPLRVKNLMLAHNAVRP
jgi:hypothetical protein